MPNGLNYLEPNSWHERSITFLSNEEDLKCFISIYPDGGNFSKRIYVGWLLKTDTLPQQTRLVFHYGPDNFRGFVLPGFYWLSGGKRNMYKTQPVSGILIALCFDKKH